jgi:hypothetical protein
VLALEGGHGGGRLRPGEPVDLREVEPMGAQRHLQAGDLRVRSRVNRRGGSQRRDGDYEHDATAHEPDQFGSPVVIPARSGIIRAVATMADLDALALAMPEATKEVSEDGRPAYQAHGKTFCFHRSRRPDAVDQSTGERFDDVLMFRVDGQEAKELVLADPRGLFFTTPHFNGYPAVLIRIPDLARLELDELRDVVVDAWLTRAHKRVAKAWLAANEPAGD